MPRQGWIPGCYGMTHPAVLAAATGLVYRGKGEALEILVGTRGPGRWESGTLTIAPGGFLDPQDTSPRACAEREVLEEVRIHAIGETPSFYEGGPTQYRWRWDAKLQQAIRTDELVQEIPVVTLNFLLRWVTGAPHPTKEILNPRWVMVSDFRKSSHTDCSFDQAKVFEEALKALRLL